MHTILVSNQQKEDISAKNLRTKRRTKSHSKNDSSDSGNKFIAQQRHNNAPFLYMERGVLRRNKNSISLSYNLNIAAQRTIFNI